MPDAFFVSDSSLPDLKRISGTDAKLSAVQNYLFLLLENLRWLLRNLSPENFNESEMTDWIGKTVKAETIISNTVITNELYSEYGAIADLTVDSLRTDYRRAQRCLAGDTSPLDYLRIHDELIEFVTAETDGTQTEQLAVNGRVFYWTDATMTQMTSERVTAYPVMVYVYTEDVKGAFRFENVTHHGQTVKVPVLTLGAGDEQGHNYATLYKGTQGLQLLYNDASGKNIGMTCSREGYTDLYGLRKPVRLNLSGWDAGRFTELLDGGINNGYLVDFDAQSRPIRITDAENHETAILWESNDLFDAQPIPVAQDITHGLKLFRVLNSDGTYWADRGNAYVFVLDGGRDLYIATPDGGPLGLSYFWGGYSGTRVYEYDSPYSGQRWTYDAATGLHWGTWLHPGSTVGVDPPASAYTFYVPSFVSREAGLTAVRAYIEG